MRNKIYKPKQANVIRLKTYLSKVKTKTNGK